MQSRNNVEISILGDNLTQDIIEYKKNGKGSSICINRRLVKREREQSAGVRLQYIVNDG